MWDSESDVWLADLTDGVGHDRGGDVTHIYPRNNEICRFRIWCLMCESWRWCVLWRSELVSDMRPRSDMGQVDLSNKVWWVECELHWQSPQYPVNVLISWANPLIPIWSKMGVCARASGTMKSYLTHRRQGLEGSMENCLLCSQLAVNVAQKKGHCGRYWLFRSLRPEEG